MLSKDRGLHQSEDLTDSAVSSLRHFLKFDFLQHTQSDCIAMYLKGVGLTQLNMNWARFFFISFLSVNTVSEASIFSDS